MPLINKTSMSEIDPYIGPKIFNLRKIMGLTQLDLAKKVKKQQQWISNLEKSYLKKNVVITDHDLVNLAFALDTSVEKLITPDTVAFGIPEPKEPKKRQSHKRNKNKTTTRKPTQTPVDTEAVKAFLIAVCKNGLTAKSLLDLYKTCCSDASEGALLHDMLNNCPEAKTYVIEKILSHLPYDL